MVCQSPPYLANRTLYSLGEERLNCPKSVMRDRFKDMNAEEYDITTDLKFRELDQ